MSPWEFDDGEHDVGCATSNTCQLAQMVSGPTGQPAGAGSAELAVGTAATSRKMALWTTALGGTRLSQITNLSYSSYRQTGGPFAVPIVFDVDYDVTDTDTTAQGQMIYLPTYGDTSSSPQGTWISWNARTTGRWGGTLPGWVIHPAPPAVMRFISNPCYLWPPLSAPCTWQDLLTTFPNIGVAAHGRFGFEVGDSVASHQWLGVFRGNVDNLQITVGGVASTNDFELASAASVPASAPDTLPTFAPGGIVSGGRLAMGTIQRGAVIVEFIHGASQAQRQAAIDAIQGQVVGGYRITANDGFYYVKVADDGTWVSVSVAIAKLQKLSQVAVAAPLIVSEPSESYLKPKDAGAYHAWNLDSTQGRALNWGLERVRAPRAWGCSVGSDNVTVGILDIGADTVATDNTGNPLTDVQLNTSYVNNFEHPIGQTERFVHGTMVASVLAARGNNNVGMTGTMWNARLLLANLNTDPDSVGRQAAGLGLDSVPLDLARIQRHLVKLGELGADIINFSQNPKWNHTPSMNDTLDVSLVRSRADMVAQAIRILAAEGRHPLFVISAGNQKLDAYWGAYTAANLYADVRDQIIVVGASDQNDHLANWLVLVGTNFGSVVDVYAPGSGIGVMDGGQGGSEVVAGDGTSFAAPIVAGIAGLLKDFDQSLSAAAIKQLIITGAQRRSTPVEAGKFLVDAYHSLRAASERAGGPLCGNQPVWIQNKQIVVQRTPGGATEVLSTLANPAWDLDVWHGGHNLSYVTTNAFGAAIEGNLS